MKEEEKMKHSRTEERIYKINFKKTKKRKKMEINLVKQRLRILDTMKE